MHLIPLLAPILLITPLTTACLLITGYLDTDGSAFTVTTTDNGIVTCDSIGLGWRIDQDGHFSANCIKGYVYASTLDGKQAWYGNPKTAFAFSQSPVSVGAPKVFKVSEKLFGC